MANRSSPNPKAHPILFDAPQFERISEKKGTYLDIETQAMVYLLSKIIKIINACQSEIDI